MKIKFIILTIIFSNILYASEYEDFKVINNLYKQRNFNAALYKSKQFLSHYPKSNRNKAIRDKLAKLYFLNKDYQNSIKEFKILLLAEKNLKEKDEYYYYLSRSYAFIGDFNNLNLYKSFIKNQALREKTDYEVAKDLMTNNHNREAISILKLISLNDNVYKNDVMMSLAIAYFNNANYKEASDILSKYKNLDTTKNVALINYIHAASLYKTNNIDEALPIFEFVFSNFSDDVYGKKSFLSLIEIYTNRGDLANTQRLLDEVQDKNLYNEAVFMIGDLYASKNKFEYALDLYSTLDSKEPKLIFNKAYVLYKLDRLSEALKLFETLVDTEYYNKAMYHIFAINYKLGNYKKIIDNRDLVKKVVVSQIDTDNINTIIANSAYQLKDYKLAKDYYGRLFAINTKLENLFRVILIDTQLLDINDLENRFMQYKKLFPNDKIYKKDIYLYIGEAFFKSGNTEKAINLYKEYLDNDTNFEILSSLLILLMDTRNYEDMDFYLSLANNEDEFAYLKAISMIGLGEYEKADTYLTKIENSSLLKENINYKVKLNKLRNYFLWGKYEDAISYGEYLLNIKDINKKVDIYYEILDKIAISYFRLDNYEKARFFYEKIAEISGYDIYAKYQIADTYINEKNYEKAKHILNDIKNNYSFSFYAEQAYYKYLNILALENNLSEYERQKNTFFEKFPNSKFKDNILNKTANIYIANNKTDEAIKTIKNINENIDDESIKDTNIFRLINVKLSKKDYNDVDKLIEQISDEVEKIYYMSVYFSKTKQLEKAVKENVKLLKSEKYKAYASQELGDYWIFHKNQEKAKTHYLNALKFNSQNKIYLNEKLANIYYQEKNYNEAIKYYAYLFDNNSLDVGLKLAEIYEKIGKNKDAKKIYISLIKKNKSGNVYEYSLEKLIYFNLLDNNKKEAQKYLKELKKVNVNKAKKYNAYF